jgi:cytochrome o ubiquinol oxidase operon protein cyoD
MKSIAGNNTSNSGSGFTYALGFILSLALTISAYLLVKRHLDSHHLIFTDRVLVLGVAGLAITQLFVQLVFFLHLNRESKPWWNNTALFFAGIVVFILVFGSVWIMDNLNYHHATNKTHDGHRLIEPSQVNRYIINDEGIHE